MTRRGVIAVACFAIAIVALLALPQTVKAPVYAREMAAVKAITTIHTTQTQYFFEHGRYAATLQELDMPEILDGFRFRMTTTADGYTVRVTGTGHSYYSDKSMTIHQHNGPGEPTLADPILGGHV